MAKSQLQLALETYRARLLSFDSRVLAATSAAYAPIKAALLQQIDELSALQAANSNLTGGEFWRLARAQELLAQVEAEMTRLSGPLTNIVGSAQSIVVQAAGDQAKTLAGLSADTAAKAAEVRSAWNTLPTSAVNDLIGRLSDGSPLKAWIDQFGVDTSAKLQEAVTTGLALGTHPMVIAANLAQATDVAETRLQAFARTSMLDAYRSSSLRSYSEQSDILSGWAWSSAQDDSVCLQCLSMDGEVFGLDVEFFPAHISCRCASLPILKGVDSQVRQSGSDWFDGLSADQQNAMLPKWAQADFAAGKIQLSDFAHLQRDNQWGDRYQQATQAQARANAASREDGA